MPSDATNERLPGVTRLRATLQGFCDYYFQYPERALYFTQFDRMHTTQEDNVQLQELKRNDAQIINDPVSQLIVIGMRDGSLRANLDPHKTSTTIYTIIWGLERRLGVSAATFEVEYKQNQRTIYEETCQIIVQGLITR